MHRSVLTTLFLLAATPAAAGELDLGLGLQATHTGWSDDHGGGPAVSAGWWFNSWLGISFIAKEHYATVDDRFMSYFSLNGAVRRSVGGLRIAGTLGLVHQHEEPYAAIQHMPVASAFGVADGIRHRMASRAGLQLALPFRDRAKGEWYVALDLDATAFPEAERGPRWMSSAGLSVGFTHDFAKSSPTTPVARR
jgi:hypothetical protein